MIRDIDKEIAQFGFIKVSERDRYIGYERMVATNDYEFIQRVDLIKAKNKEDHILMSYEKGNVDNQTVGLRLEELEVFMKKMKMWSDRNE